MSQDKFKPASTAEIVAAFTSDTLRLDIPRLVPTVDMAVTYSVGSDRYAATIVGVSKSGKRFAFQDDIARRADSHGLSEDQTYTYARDPQADVRTAYLAKDGRWRVMGRGYPMVLGHRRAYCDPNF